MDFDTYLTRIAELDLAHDTDTQDSPVPLIVTATDSFYAVFERFVAHWTAGADVLVWPAYIGIPHAAQSAVRLMHTPHGEDVVHYSWQWTLVTRDPTDPPHADDVFGPEQLEAAQTRVSLTIQQVLTRPTPYFVVQARIHSPHFTVPDRILLELPTVTQITFTPSPADSVIGFDAVWQFDHTTWSLRDALVEAVARARTIPRPHWLRHSQPSRPRTVVQWVMARPERHSALLILGVSLMILLLILTP